MQRIAQTPARSSVFPSLRRWATRLIRLITCGVLLLATVICVRACVIDSRVPRARRGAPSVQPWLRRGHDVDVLIYVTSSGNRSALRGVEQPTLLFRNFSGDVNATVAVPAETRRAGAPLWAHVCVRPTRDAEQHCVGAVPLTVLRPWKMPGTRLPPIEAVPFWRFKYYPVVLRLLDVGGDGALDAAGLEGDGLRRLGVQTDVRRRDGEAVYMPIAFIDDELALRGSSAVLSHNLSMPAAAFSFRLVWAAPLPFMVRRGIRDHFRVLAARYPEHLVDRLRWQMRDEIAWRLVALLVLKFSYLLIYMYCLDAGVDRILRARALHALIGILGVILGMVTASYMCGIALFVVVAYRYSRPRVHNYHHEATVRLYAATLPLLACVLLDSYLYDAQPAYYSVLMWYFLFVITTGEICVWYNVGDSSSRNTAVMLLTFAGTSVLDPKYAATIVRGAFLAAAGWYLSMAGTRYHREATAHLYLVTFPLLLGGALYSLVYDGHGTYYEWLDATFADTTYYIGFVAMAQQPWINYRLKSVARLPTKLLVYKIVATFADDAFAWLVEMPLKYRLMTLRDDVVFVVFLYQWWAYRVDGSRQHEYHWRR